MRSVISFKPAGMIKLLAAVALSAQLAACVPVLIGGAAAGGVIAADRRSSGTYIDDQGIELKAAKQINDKIGDNIHANITSYNRNVLLTGEAFNEASKVQAEEIVKSLGNVRNITNEITIAAKTGLRSRSIDSYLTSKVKARMVSARLFPVNAVKVFSENSTVYLMGLVTKQEGDDAVQIARDTDGVEKVVKVFEYIDAAPQ